MAQIFVYSPFSGSMIAQANYCNQAGNPPHPTVAALGGCCPVDVSGSAGGAVNFYGSSLVQSIVTRQVTNCSAAPSPWRDGVVVDLYRQPGGRCYIGTVGYAHLGNRVANGTYNGRTFQVGTLLSVGSCNCTCYRSVHVHLQSNGSPTGYGCNVPLTGGTSVLFTWNEPTNCVS